MVNGIGRILAFYRPRALPFLWQRCRGHAHVPSYQAADITSTRAPWQGASRLRKSIMVLVLCLSLLPLLGGCTLEVTSSPYWYYGPYPYRGYRHRYWYYHPPVFWWYYRFQYWG